MGGIYWFPGLNEIATTLNLLLNKDVSVADGTAITTSPTIAGTYIDENGKLGALVLVDLPLASYAGAALTMIPGNVAATNIKAGTLSDEIGENLHEVFNIMVAFFNQGDVPHIRFSEMHIAPPAFPGEIDAFLSDDVRHADFDVDIAGYGAGKMSLYAI